MEFLLLLGQLSSEFGDLGLQVCNLVMELCGVSLKFTTVLLQLLTYFLLFPETICMREDTYNTENTLKCLKMVRQDLQRHVFSVSKKTIKQTV